MIYCDFDTYTDLYPDTQMDEETFGALAFRASHLIDRETMGRAEGFADELKEELSAACVRLVALLDRQDALSIRAQGGAVTSASTDGYSESYATPNELNGAFRQLATMILQEALGHDPYGLLCRWL